MATPTPGTHITRTSATLSFSYNTIYLETQSGSQLSAGFSGRGYPINIDTSNTTITIQGAVNICTPGDNKPIFLITPGVKNFRIAGVGQYTTIDISGSSGFEGFVKCGDISSNNLTTSICDISNIGITSTASTLANSCGWVYTGGNATIRNCYSTGNITGNNCGGIIGSGYNYSVDSARNIFSNKCNVYNSYSSGDISGNYCGGIASSPFIGLIDRCYSTGNMYGLKCGGILGVREAGPNFYNQWRNSFGPTIQNSFSSNPTVDGSNCGGIISLMDISNTIINCYSNVNSITDIVSLAFGGIAGGLSDASASNNTLNFCYSVTNNASCSLIYGLTTGATIANSNNVSSWTDATSRQYLFYTPPAVNTFSSYWYSAGLNNPYNIILNSVTGLSASLNSDLKIILDISGTSYLTLSTNILYNIQNNIIPSDTFSTLNGNLRPTQYFRIINNVLILDTIGYNKNISTYPVRLITGVSPVSNNQFYKIDSYIRYNILASPITYSTGQNQNSLDIFLNI